MQTKQWITRNQMEFNDGKQIFQQNSINFTNAKWKLNERKGKKTNQKWFNWEEFLCPVEQQSYMFVTKFTHLPLQMYRNIDNEMLLLLNTSRFEFYFLLNT